MNIKETKLKSLLRPIVESILKEQVQLYARFGSHRACEKAYGTLSGAPVPQHIYSFYYPGNYYKVTPEQAERMRKITGVTITKKLPGDIDKWIM